MRPKLSFSYRNYSIAALSSKQDTLRWGVFINRRLGYELVKFQMIDLITLYFIIFDIKSLKRCEIKFERSVTFLLEDVLFVK